MATKKKAVYPDPEPKMDDKRRDFIAETTVRLLEARLKFTGGSVFEGDVAQMMDAANKIADKLGI